MNDDRDPILTRIFAEQNSPVDGSEFAARVALMMDRDLRSARSYRIGMIIAVLVVASLLAPWLAQVCALAVGSVVAGLSTTRALSSFPLAWLALCSIVGSFLPAIHLGITRRW